MRRWALILTMASSVLPAPTRGQEAPPTQARTAEALIEHAREIYSVRRAELPPTCPEATTSEIVVCRPYAEDDSQRLPSPTERANASGERPPDPVPDAPSVFGIPPCKSYMVCTSVGRAPPPIYIIDLDAIPEPLTPEEAALVRRADPAPTAPANPGEASPAAAP
jgi:hypothetical protein